ncbi:YncE family protein [Actinoplanes sp. NPDC023936]|uniref:YncE family protein n=1 Tax=Actinoplanes sp. NPDC023936 TaxID=3154910 RepID=UPI0033EA1B10
MSSTSRRAAVAAVAIAAGVLAAPGAASAHSGQDAATVASAELIKGLYQSDYSQRNKALWVTAAVGRPPVTSSALLKVDPKTLEIEATITPPVTNETTGAVEAVYGVGVDDEYNRVWVTATRNNAVAVYDQRTGAHVASFANVPHAREIVVDEKHNTVWASAFTSGELVAYDSKTLVEKKRVVVEGAGPTGLVVDEKTGTLYAADLNNDRIIEVSPKAETPRFIATGDGPISIDLSADGKTAYTANQTAGSVSFVNLKKGTVTAEVATGAGALSVAYEERSGTVLVANRTAATVTVVDATTAVVEENLVTAANPNHIETANGKAYAVDKSGAGATGGDFIYKIDPAN